MKHRDERERERERGRRETGREHPLYQDEDEAKRHRAQQTAVTSVQQHAQHSEQTHVHVHVLVVSDSTNMTLYCVHG